MANKTIHELTATTSADAADEIALWVAASNLQKRITKANFLGGSMTGAGVVATGGYTLTVPATGTAALLATTQTFTGNKTFSGTNAFSGPNTFSGQVTMTAFMALTQQITSLASDAFTATASNVVLDTEGAAATDNLATINGGSVDGTIIILRSANGNRDITIKSGTGNIRTAGAADRLLGTTRERWMGMYYQPANIWVEIAYSANPA